MSAVFFDAVCQGFRVASRKVDASQTGKARLHSSWLKFASYWFVAYAVVAVLPGSVASAQKAAGLSKKYHEENAAGIIWDFREFLSMPNVAENIDDMLVNANYIVGYIGKRGFKSEIISAGGAPYVVAERTGSPSAPVVLIYAHFDGQPVIPANWSSPPFSPTLWTTNPLTAGASQLSWEQEHFDLDWRVVARSAGDDKAPLIALMAAIDALVEAEAMPDITIKLLLDGEEERGSPTLAGILDQVGEQLKADIMLFCDGPMHQSGRRQLVLGVRGSMTIDLKTFGANRPLHSGHYGNWAPNPNEILMRLLLSLKDDSGRILVEGFSENVAEVSKSERLAIQAMPSVDSQIKQELGLGNSEIVGERLEASLMRPALIVKGFQGGGVGAISRNIIEPYAEASLNLRLVSGQKPERVAELLRAHFRKIGMTVSDREPSRGEPRERHLQMSVRPGGYRSFRTSVESEIVIKLKQIMDRLGGQETLITPTMGGSLPIYLFEDKLKLPILIVPTANHDNNQHGRDENLRLANLFSAIEMYAELLEGLADEM